jgi:hypothetical protein
MTLNLFSSRHKLRSNVSVLQNCVCVSVKGSDRKRGRGKMGSKEEERGVKGKMKKEIEKEGDGKIEKRETK